MFRDQIVVLLNCVYLLIAMLIQNSFQHVTPNRINIISTNSLMLVVNLEKRVCLWILLY